MYDDEYSVHLIRQPVHDVAHRAEWPMRPAPCAGAPACLGQIHVAKVAGRAARQLVMGHRRVSPYLSGVVVTTSTTLHPCQSMCKARLVTLQPHRCIDQGGAS